MKYRKERLWKCHKSMGIFALGIGHNWKFFLNGAELSLNSANLGNLINHGSMNWVQFKDPVTHICLAGAG